MYGIAFAESRGHLKKGTFSSCRISVCLPDLFHSPFPFLHQHISASVISLALSSFGAYLGDRETGVRFNLDIWRWVEVVERAGHVSVPHWWWTAKERCGSSVLSVCLCVAVEHTENHVYLYLVSSTERSSQVLINICWGKKIVLKACEKIK